MAATTTDSQYGGACMLNKQPLLQLSTALGKLGSMHVRKVSYQISRCSPHRLIRDNTFRFYGIFPLNKSLLKKKFSLGEKCCP